MANERNEMKEKRWKGKKLAHDRAYVNVVCHAFMSYGVGQDRRNGKRERKVVVLFTSL